MTSQIASTATSDVLPAGGTDIVDKESLPPLMRDRAFYGMTVTQFLGAFNDSVFKQIVALLCTKVAVDGGPRFADRQNVPLAFFAASFVLLSGISGYLADITTKRTIIVWSKVAEIVVMGAGVAAFLLMAPRIESGAGGEDLLTNGLPWLLIIVLTLMGAQSAVFGPSKYGILPEMVRSRDLPTFNGLIQMTTFIALVAGPALGGVLMDLFPHDLWKAGLFCVGLAVVGTCTSLLVRQTPIAQPHAPFRWSALWIPPDIRALLRQDRPLLRALIVYTVFWFVAAVAYPAMNALGKIVFRRSDTQTSLLTASLSVGIGVGFVLAGWLSRGKVGFRWMPLGAWGLIICFVLLAITAVPDFCRVIQSFIGNFGGLVRTMERVFGPVTPEVIGYALSLFELAIAGLFVGFFALPVQVFLQTRPPDALKGRMIGTSNLANWMGIIASTFFYDYCKDAALAIGLNSAAVFAVLAAIMLPLAIFYRPRELLLSTN